MTISISISKTNRIYDHHAYHQTTFSPFLQGPSTWEQAAMTSSPLKAPPGQASTSSTRPTWCRGRGRSSVTWRARAEAGPSSRLVSCSCLWVVYAGRLLSFINLIFAGQRCHLSHYALLETGIKDDVAFITILARITILISVTAARTTFTGLHLMKLK